MAFSYSFTQSIEVLYYLELKSRLQKNEYLTIKSIAETLDMPMPSMKRLVSLLKNSGLIQSKKGVNGGLALVRRVEDISFYDVLEAVEGRSPIFKVYKDFETSSFVHKDEAEKMIDQLDASLDKAESQLMVTLKEKKISELF
ncbi:Rrf2 family transcriptional regulator [Fructobacillus sp. M1-21]|uniref:Rrf2 family transcriptional regulator n=1 Tax=Fructobacillus papyrifericola TaxID=2713172 RepID=A0ABS5QUV1_9LACO|nr:Rrf2 family transcriptional regulator [Fructobacillus papyrifericola]MBS9336181.1 Rrf2 family transcriptional regulator [Fructobacillus papyrifericola]